MKGIPTPEPHEDFTADPAELFFDLSFVFAFSRLVHYLVHHPDWGGFGEFVLLFTMIWLPWSQFTWSANAVAGNSRQVRLLFMLATVASVPMAASITTAFDDGGPAFAIAASVILAMGLFTMFAGLTAEPEVRASIIRYSIPNWIAIAVMIVGAFFDGGVRTAMWVGAMLIIFAGTILAGSSEWLVRPGHFAERHGLLVIVALGEVIVAVAAPIVDSLQEGDGLPGRTIAALVASGVFATLLWWGYFDRPNPALEHRHGQLDDRTESGRFARDIYTYSHYPLIAGIILAAAALEELTIHPQDPLATPFRWMLLGGLGLYLLSVVVAIARAFQAPATERVAAAVVLAAVIILTGNTDGLTVLVIIDVVLLATLAAEHLRVERPADSIAAGAA